MDTFKTLGARSNTPQNGNLFFTFAIEAVISEKLYNVIAQHIEQRRSESNPESVFTYTPSAPSISPQTPAE